MTSTLNFVHTLLSDRDTKWDTIAQALTLFDTTGLLPRPTHDNLSDEQNIFFNYICAVFISRHRFDKISGSTIEDIRTRNDGQNDFYQKSCVDFLMQYFGEQLLTSPRKELKNISFLAALCQENINGYQQNISPLFVWMDVMGASAFETIRVVNQAETYDSFLGRMFECLRDDGRSDPSERRRFEGLLLRSSINIANITYNSKPAVSYFCSPALWDAYIRGGGHPDVEVSYNYRELPLWEALVEKSDGQKNTVLNTHLKKWGQEHSKNVEKIIENAYFTRLKKRLNFCCRYQELKDVVTSSHNWAEYVDQEGRTPMMLSVAQHKSAYKIFSAKKYRAALEKRDQKGRNVLAYAIKDISKISSDAIPFLLSIPALLTLPEDGRGLIQHLDDFNAGLRGVGSYSPPEDNALRLEHMTAWFGAEEHHTFVSNIIANRYFHDSGNQTCVARLVRLGAMDVVQNQQLRGAMVLCVAATLAQLIQKYNRSYTWKPSEQLNPETESKQISANNALNKYIPWLEKLLDTALAPEFHNNASQKWNEILPQSLFQSIGRDYSFHALCDRMSKNALNNALQHIENSSEPTKSRKL